MLSVYYGNNYTKREEAYRNLLASFPQDKLAHMSGEEALASGLEELAMGTSMFSEVRFIAIRKLTDSKEGLDLLEQMYAGMVASRDHFIIVEDKLLAPILNKLKKAGADVYEHTRTKFETDKLDKAKKLEANKIYALSDALGRRDRRALWVEYRRALYRGVSAEEVLWKLSWQFKNMLLASSWSTPAESGLHPYVYDKARLGAKRYAKDEMRALSGELLSLWEASHTQGRDLELALEQLILSV